jgi:hypothetical protein
MLSNIYNNFSNTIYSNPLNFGSLEVLEYVIFIYLIYKYNPFNITTKYPEYTNILVLLVALVYVMLFYFLKENLTVNVTGIGETNFLIKAILTLGVFILSICLVKYVGLFITNGYFGILALIRYAILAIIILFALTIAYLVAKPIFDDAKKADRNSLRALLVNLVMYMPCLVIAFMDYAKNQYNITTKPVFLLLLAEIVLVVLWFIIPKILHTFFTKNGLQLIKEPQYLNKESILGTVEELYGNSIDSDESKFNYHYALSSWFYLNPQPPNTNPSYTKYTTILNYGNKPAIEFNGKLNSLRVVVESEKDPGQRTRVEIFQTNKILFQKWNNIVINYDHGTMDVFLNGEIVGSKPGIAPYMTFESINIGSNNGIHGGISNVMYYKENLSKSNIELMYQTLRNKKEPFV